MDRPLRSVFGPSDRRRPSGRRVAGGTRSIGASSAVPAGADGRLGASRRAAAAGLVGRVGGRRPRWRLAVGRALESRLGPGLGRRRRASLRVGRAAAPAARPWPARAVGGTGRRCRPPASHRSAWCSDDGQHEVLPPLESRKVAVGPDIAADPLAGAVGRARLAVEDGPAVAVAVRAAGRRSRASAAVSARTSQIASRLSQSSIRWIASQVTLAAYRSCRPRASRA